MSQHSDVAKKPYAAIWRGRAYGLTDKHGILSVHSRPDLAHRAVTRQRDALQALWGAYQPMFFYQVIDRRDGHVVAAIF